jgi:hypothetical protein
MFVALRHCSSRIAQTYQLVLVLGIPSRFLISFLAALTTAQSSHMDNDDGFHRSLHLDLCCRHKKSELGDCMRG